MVPITQQHTATHHGDSSEVLLKVVLEFANHAVVPAVFRLGAARIINIIMKKSEEELETAPEPELKRGRESGMKSTPWASR